MRPPARARKSATPKPSSAARRRGKRPRRAVEIAMDGVPRPRWQARFAAFCSRILREAGCEEWDVSVLLCGDKRMAELNERYRGKKGPTDVLSFPREEAGGTASGAAARAVEGDLAVSLDTLRRNAAAFGCTQEEELKRLAVHGILHLAGMDHGRGRAGSMMELQERLLARLENVRVSGGQTL